MSITNKTQRIVLTFFFLLSFSVFFFGCGQSDSKDKKHADSLLYKTGVQKYEVGDYDSALSYFEKTIQLNPNHIDALLDVGILYEDYKKDYAKAVEAYRQFLAKQPEGDKAEMVKGWLLKLAENQGHKVADLPKAASKKQGALLQVNTQAIEENKELKKEISILNARITQINKEHFENEEALKDKIKELSNQLVDSKKQVQNLQKNLDTQLEESEESQSKVLAQVQAKLKQAEIRNEQLKNEQTKLAEEYEKKIAELNQTLQQEAKGEQGLVVSLNNVKAEKEALEGKNSQLQFELEKLKEAFTTATQERARLNELLQEKESNIGALRGQLAKLSQQNSFEATERKAYERQIALLKQKNNILEEERKKYLNYLSRNKTNELQETAATQMIRSRNTPVPKPIKEVAPPRDYELVTYHRVKRGETLMMIAGYNHIYGDRSKWKLIYEANKTNIDDPNVLVPGQILLVPR